MRARRRAARRRPRGDRARRRCCTTSTSARTLRERGVEVGRGRRPRPGARGGGAARTPTSRRPPRGDRRRPGVRARSRARAARSTSTPRCALVADAASAGVERFVMASTCSNYGRMADPTVPIDETGVLAPVSLYAEQKVAVERHLLALDPAPFAVDLPALRDRLRRRAADALRPHGQRVHPRPLGRPHGSRSSASSSGGRTCTSATPRAACAPCSRRRPRASPARSSTSATRARTTASSTSSSEIRRADRPRRGRVRQARRGPARLQGLFAKVASGSATRSPSTVPDGIARSSRRSTRRASRMPFDRRVPEHRLSADPALRPPARRRGHRGGRWTCCESGWLTHGPADGTRSRRAFARAPRREARGRGLLLHGGAAPRLPGRGRRARATR